MSVFQVITQTIQETIQKKLIAYCFEPSASPIAMAAAKLYYGERSHSFKSMKVSGILCFVADRKT